MPQWAQGGVSLVGPLNAYYKIRYIKEPMKLTVNQIDN